jgi:4-carboxymuconolactone decarboxylase
MARLPYPDPATQSEQVREYIARSGGLNIVRMLSHASPTVFEGFNKLTSGLMVHSKLDPILREIGILRVGYLSKAAYEVYHHEAVGRAVGITEAQIEALKRGGTDSVWSEAQQTVLNFTDDVVLNVRASDANLAALRKHLDETEVVDLLMAIGCYMMVSRLLETTGVDLDALPLTLGRTKAGS